MALSSGVNVLMDARCGWRSAGECLPGRGVHFSLDLRQDGLKLRTRTCHFAFDALTKDIEWIAFALHPFKRITVAILLRIALIMAAEAACDRLNERRALTA